MLADCSGTQFEKARRPPERRVKSRDSDSLPPGAMHPKAYAAVTTSTLRRANGSCWPDARTPAQGHGGYDARSGVDIDQVTTPDVRSIGKPLGGDCRERGDALPVGGCTPTERLSRTGGPLRSVHH
jgi:hypothetical protein